MFPAKTERSTVEIGVKTWNVSLPISQTCHVSRSRRDPLSITGPAFASSASSSDSEESDEDDEEEEDDLGQGNIFFQP